MGQLDTGIAGVEKCAERGGVDELVQAVDLVLDASSDTGHRAASELWIHQARPGSGLLNAE